MTNITGLKLCVTKSKLLDCERKTLIRLTKIKKLNLNDEMKSPNFDMFNIIKIMISSQNFK